MCSRQRWLGLGLGLGLATGGCTREPAAEDPAAATAPGPAAPPPSVPDVEGSIDGVVRLDGTPVDPFRVDAKATVLVFVSTHCPISNRYAPTLRALARDWAAEGVDLWLAYPDPDDDPAAIREHRAAFALELPTLRDPEHALVARARVRVTPEAAVFGPGGAEPAYHGRIDDRVAEFGKVRAEASTHELRDAVQAVLEGRRPSPANGAAIGCYISDLR